MSVMLGDVLSAERKGISIDSDLHRRLIGWIGLLLPYLLFVAVTIRPTEKLHTLLPSLSAYYYSSGLALLEGTLAGLALFLFAYQGYPGKYQWADKTAAKVAATAAAFIALCPTYPLKDVPAAAWWSPTAGKIHDWASAVMFLMFAIFSLWLFRLTDPKTAAPSRDKQLRNHLYLAFGIAILVGAGVVVYLLKTEKTDNPNVLIPEWVIITSFSASWLVKGGVLSRWLPD